MNKAGFESVDAYIARHPQEVRATLRRVRSIIRKALPAAEETISYQIPSYRLHGTYVVYFAGWKEHYSVYPVTDRVVAKVGSQLRPYKVSKGTVRFPFSQPVPARLIEGIAKCLAQEAADRAAAKAARPKTSGGRRPRTTRRRS
jgi:uncharacterized protein YdhG (YjbR/CyaY superfamily)